MTKEELTRRIALRIRKNREALEMTQEELALKVGYSGRAMTSRIEKGKVDLPISQLVKIADVLGVTVSYLIGENND